MRLALHHNLLAWWEQMFTRDRWSLNWKDIQSHPCQRWVFFSMVLYINTNEWASNAGRDIIATYLPPHHYVGSGRHSCLKGFWVFVNLCPPSIISHYWSLNKEGLLVMVVIWHDGVTLCLRWGWCVIFWHDIFGMAPPVLLSLANHSVRSQDQITQIRIMPSQRSSKPHPSNSSHQGSPAQSPLLAPFLHPRPVPRSRACNRDAELRTTVIREDWENIFWLTQHENICRLLVKLAVIFAKFIKPVLNGHLVYRESFIAQCPVTLFLPFHL